MAETSSEAAASVVTVTEATTVSPKQSPKPDHHQQDVENHQMTTSTKKPLTQIITLIKLVLTFVAFLLSLLILALIIWLLYVRDHNCEYLLQLRKLQYGIIIGLIVTFVLSNLALFLVMKSRFPVPGIFLLMIPLILMLIVGLVLIGAYKMESRSIPASPQELKTKILVDDNSWDTIKSCIYDTKTCQSLASRSYMLKPYDFTTSKLSSLESGCCRPPASCDMEYFNATYWVKGDGGNDGSDPYDPDCNLWTNGGANLCYDCHACKQGFLTTIQGKWITLGKLLVSMAIILITSHLILFVISLWERYAG